MSARSSAIDGRPRAPSGGSSGPRSSNRRLSRANDELTALVAQLRIANQTMLQSSEEAQSGREEVETLNEEFQATNEELETLNEELTASVEELRVANEDLAARTEELRLQAVALEEQKQHREEEHSRLESVLASLGDAVVAVDHEGRTLATNPAYDRLFGGPDAEIVPEDLAGLPLPRGRVAAAPGGPRRALPDGVRGQRSRRASVAGSRPSPNRSRARIGRGAAWSRSGTSRSARCGSAWSG